jgi:LysM repeat protein
MMIKKQTCVNIILFACLIVLSIITIGCKQITPGGVGIKPTGIQQESLQPTSTLPTPATAITSPVPVEKYTRSQAITYTIQTGDTLFGIAEKFNLRPDTILWGNPETFEDLTNVSLMPGIVLNILPVDGAYHRWKAGEDLNEVAKTYGVSTQAIVNWPGNHLDPQTLGDYSNPNIEPGTMLVIPGGQLDFVSWSSPYPVHAPTVIPQTGVEAFYETLFVIPVGEGSLQYLGGDQPDSEINGPNAIAVLPDGSFVIADLVGNRLWRYESTGKLLKSIDLYSIGIEQVTDLRATNTELFELEIRNERYRVNRLSFDGELIASYDIPDGFHIENGLTGISVDCEGEVLLEMAGSDLYRLVDSQGNLYSSIEKTDYYCNGKSYRVVNSGQGTIPKFIAGSIPLETQLTTGLGGLNLLVVLQDGSFYMIRDDVVNDRVIQVDQTVHYINAGGVQQGVARLPLAEYYYPIMRNLAVGLDGNVYAILPQSDSIHIIRLNFYKSLEPLVPGAVQPFIVVSTSNPE